MGAIHPKEVIMSDQVKDDIERIKRSADKIASIAAAQVHGVFATSLNLVAENLEKLEKAIAKHTDK